MNIADLKVRQGKVEVEGEIVDLGDVKTFQKFGKEGKVMSATLKDDTGKITLSLWNDDCDNVHKGSKVKITNGYVNEFQGEKQLTAGRFGKLEILS